MSYQIIMSGVVTEAVSPPVNLKQGGPTGLTNRVEFEALV